MKTASIYHNVEYNEGKPVVNVLLETDFSKEIRIAMQANTLMKEHKTPYPIVIEVVEGNIDFGVQGEVRNIHKGELIALEGNVPHDLKANENSILRLTLTKYDSENRVKNVAEG